MKKDLVFKAVLVLVIFFITYQFGVKPFMNGEAFKQRRDNTGWANGKLGKEPDVYDVVVVGEEPEGIAAALSASRLGARTLLICEGGDLGGSFAKSMCVSLNSAPGANGENLDRGIFSEIKGKLGREFSIPEYKRVLEKLIAGEKNIKLVYNAEIDLPVIKNGTITGVDVLVKGKKYVYKGMRFIDATRDGSLLELCGVPYYAGSGDINMDRVFYPVKLNFEVVGVDQELLHTALKSYRSEFVSLVEKYKFSHFNMRFNDFSIINQGESRYIIQGLEITGVNLQDRGETTAAYTMALNEAKRITDYLRTHLKAFEHVKFNRAADSLHIREKRHFRGEYTLTVNDILQNRNFPDKIAVGSNPVDGIKFISNPGNNRSFIIGKPEQFGIPLGCIVPLKINNLLMVGAKASYSSLASSSAGTTGTGVTVGESAGVAAVYSIVNTVSTRELINSGNRNMVSELKELLKKQGIFLSEFSIKNPNQSNWSYPSVKKLNSLGLIAAGQDNDYRFNTAARQEDLAYLLLNGVYRMSRNSYSLEFDAKLRPYMTSGKLTWEIAGEMLLALYGEEQVKSGAYNKACEKGLIDKLLMDKKSRNDRNGLAMEEVYHLAVGNIEKYTGKKIN